jgi:hypothetical protein
MHTLLVSLPSLTRIEKCNGCGVHHYCKKLSLWINVTLFLSQAHHKFVPYQLLRLKLQFEERIFKLPVAITDKNVLPTQRLCLKVNSQIMINFIILHMY